MDFLLDPQIWLSLATLTFLEIVLGIDNVIVISILSGKVRADQQARARRFGIACALITRLILLFAISWLIGLTKPFMTVFGHDVSGRDLILLVGGLFLIAKATHEIHHSLEGTPTEELAKNGRASMTSVILQIAAMDVIFSLDSVITAVGIAKHLSVMVIAIVLSMAVMLWLAEPISRFVDRHPTVKILALSFLILIGVVLVADGVGMHFPKGYIYFTMAFSICIEMLNMKLAKKKGEPVHLRARVG